MDKNMLIKELKDVKLVTGNGFDLACEMKTRYADYFCFKNDIYNKIKEFWDETGNLRVCSEPNVAPNCNPWRKFKAIHEVTVWDLLFLLESDGWSVEEIEKLNWCDIERIIFKWLVKTEYGKEAKSNWNMVYQLLNKIKTL